MAPPLARPSPDLAQPSAKLVNSSGGVNANTAPENAAVSIEAGQESPGKPAKSDAAFNGALETDVGQDEVQHTALHQHPDSTAPCAPKPHIH